MWLNAGNWSLLEALLFGPVIVALLYAWARFDEDDRQRPRPAKRVLTALDRLAGLAFVGAVLVIGLVVVALVIDASTIGVAVGILATITVVWLLARARVRSARARRSGVTTPEMHVDDAGRGSYRRERRRGDG